jgi:hypothetical protein
MNLMALHIAFRNEHMTFYYDQNYMGSFEAYVGALFFRLFGPSVFIMRVGMLPLFALFLICIYHLTKLLYTKTFAVVTVALMSLGSHGIIIREIFTNGGYPEINVFGVLIFLMATRLALSSYSSSQKKFFQMQWRRILAYSGLGFVVGLAVWTDLLILPVVAAAGILLLFFCWREVLPWSSLALLLGFTIGAFPFIVYNIHAPAEQNSLHVLQGLQNLDAHQLQGIPYVALHKLVGAFLISLPSSTGIDSVCTVEDYPLFGAVHPTGCSILQGAWAIGFTMLWLTATYLSYTALGKLWRQTPRSFKDGQKSVQQMARLMLLVSAAITFVLFASSTAAVLHPLPSSRYLICLFLVTPALLWPLWNGSGTHKTLTPSVGIPKWIKAMLIVRIGILLLIASIFLLGTIRIFAEIPDAQAAYDKQDALVHHLIDIGETRIYTDYWTCNRIVFQSKEQIICACLNEQLGQGLDRYKPYLSIVRMAKHPAYVFPLGSPQALVFGRIHKDDEHYRQSIFDGYVIYQ